MIMSDYAATLHVSITIVHSILNRHASLFPLLSTALNKQIGRPFLHLLSSCDEYEVDEVPASPSATSGELCPDKDDASSHAPSAHGGIAALLLAASMCAAARAM